MYSSLLTVALLCLTHTTQSFPVSGYRTNLFTDVRVCASQWMLKTPSHIVDNSYLVSKLTDSPNYGFQVTDPVDKFLFIVLCGNFNT